MSLPLCAARLSGLCDGLGVAARKSALLSILNTSR
jgi:hypothetical protein